MKVKSRLRRWIRNRPAKMTLDKKMIAANVVMSDERLILITDSTGASLKRWSVSLRTLRRIALWLASRNRNVRMFGS